MEYCYPHAASLLSKIIDFFLPLVKVKSNDYPKKRKNDVAQIPFILKWIFKVEESNLNGRKTWTISPKVAKSERIILYLHGGAYVENLLIFHWIFIYKLVRTSKATVIVPDYPLAPKATCNETFLFLERVYTNILKQHIAENIIFMGDSAGGGLSLAFAQFLRNEKKPLPNQLILLAPWLDVSMENPYMLELKEKDRMLDIENLKRAGKSYAGLASIHHYKVSPIYGNFNDLPSISLFIGGHDLLLKDFEKLKEILLQKNIAINYYFYPHMFHDWMMVTPLKESKKALMQICELLKPA